MLLKNDKTLPFDKKKINKIAVIGPNADNKDALIGNYFGTPSIHYTVLEGIRQELPNAQVTYAEGCSLADSPEHFWGEKSDWGFAEALASAESADAVVLVLGLTAAIEGEEAGATSGGGDKDDIKMTGVQEELMEAVTAAGKPTVLINMTGSCIDLRAAAKKCGAIIQAWYPGQFGGLAVAQPYSEDSRHRASCP